MENDVLKKIQAVEVEILEEIHRICVENNLTYYLIAGTLIGAVRHKGFIPWDDDIDIAMPRKDYDKFIKIFDKFKNDSYKLQYFGNDPGFWLPFLKVRKKGTVMKEIYQNIYQSDSGIWVDIFPLDEVKKRGDKIQKIQKMCFDSVRSFINANAGVYNISERTFFTRFIYSFYKNSPNSKILKSVNGIMKYHGIGKKKYYINWASSYNYIKETIPKSAFYPPKLSQFEDKEFYIPNNPHEILTRIYGDYMELPPVEKRKTHSLVALSFDGVNFEKL